MTNEFVFFCRNCWIINTSSLKIWTRAKEKIYQRKKKSIKGKKSIKEKAQWDGYRVHSYADTERENIWKGGKEISKQHSTKVAFTVGTLRNNLQSVNKLTDEC